MNEESSMRFFSLDNFVEVMNMLRFDIASITIAQGIAEIEELIAWIVYYRKQIIDLCKRFIKQKRSI